MKKRNIAVMLLMCITMAGCGSTAISTRGNLDPAHISIAGDVKLYSDAEIEKRIKQVGKDYDGL